jgi:hypothetical protein
MDQQHYKRNSRALWVLIALAFVYSSAIHYLHGLTSMPLLDGGLGVAFGLYICSRPAANAIDMLYLERYSLQQIASDRSLIRWLALNLLALLAGWVVIFFGLTRLADSQLVSMGLIQ